ncbi:autotransporter assembly complex family protein [Chitinibacter sp. GC72]|uniref:autotransporter assembly complex protein TamA n=1 Tax=Chitinibacter sp. GC72 TaxID=1526917 RepID=UPI0012F74A99|nr:autotransporter assembly complex family protein [Chitinibacter sp. GC72]
MRLLTLLCAISIAISTTIAAPAWAETETFRYDIRLEAPSAARDLLVKHLNIYKWQQKNRFTPELLQRELSALPAAASDLLATEGYFDAKVEATLSEDTATVYIKVDLDEQTMVGNTSVVLQGAIVDDAERYATLMQRFSRRGDLLEDGPFSQSIWDDFKKRALQTVQARDYPAASLLDSEALIDPVRKEAQFNLLIDSGPAYVFGPATINGLSRYPESLVQERIKIAEGSRYSRSALNDLQADLQSMPHFATALVDVQLPQQAPYVAPIRVDVQEVPFKRWNGSLGYSTNTRFKSEAAYRYHDLFDKGWVFDGRVRLEQLEQAAEASVTFPRGASNWEHRVWGSVLAQDLQGLNSHLYKTGISRVQKKDEIERFFALQYQIESRKFDGGGEEYPQSFTLNHVWTQRKLDNPNNPRNGYLLQLEAGGALKQILSDASFLRLYGRGVYYSRIGQQGQFIGQASVGQTFSGSPAGITSDWLFRAGGAGSVRGYDYQSLGVQSNGSTVGGRVLATASLEYQHPVIRDWRAAAFVDYGGAGADWQSLQPVTGLGLGARWNSPVGQVGMDLAYGVDYQQIRFHFAMGLAF